MIWADVQNGLLVSSYNSDMLKYLEDGGPAGDASGDEALTRVGTAAAEGGGEEGVRRAAHEDHADRFASREDSPSKLWQILGPQRILPVSRLGSRHIERAPSDSRRPRLLLDSFGDSPPRGDNMRAGWSFRSATKTPRSATNAKDSIAKAGNTSRAETPRNYRSETPTHSLQPAARRGGWTSLAETPRLCASPAFEEQPARHRYSPIPPLQTARSVGVRPGSPQLGSVFFGAPNSRACSPQLTSVFGQPQIDRPDSPERLFRSPAHRPRTSDQQQRAGSQPVPRSLRPDELLGGASATAASLHPASPSTSSRAAKQHRTRIQARLAATLEELSSMQRKAVATTGKKDIRIDIVPEVPASVVDTIKRVICGEAWSCYDTSREGLLTKAQPDKQTNYITDELLQGARDLKTSERDKIEGVFREVARAANAVDDKSKEFKWNQVTLPWTDFARHWRGKLPLAHINRLATYFGFSKTKLRSAVYVERVGLLLTCAPEKRLKIIFSLLDINGDSIIGPRDVFAALSRMCAADEPEPPPIEDDPQSKCIKALFEGTGQLGLDFQDSTESSILEVVGIVPGSPAEQQGIHPGDMLIRVNDVLVEKLTPQEVRLILTRPDRPLSLLLVRQDRKRPNLSGLIPPTVFQNLLRIIEQRERLSTRLKVTVVNARGLRNADGVNGGKSDPYCVCEVEGKPHVRFMTKVINNSLDPEWNEEHELANYSAGDTLKFTLRDKDIGSREDGVLGIYNLKASVFLEKGFDQEVPLSGLPKGMKSTLALKIVNLGEGGIPFDEFAATFGGCEDIPFFPALAEELTGITLANMTGPMSPRTVAVRLKIIVISATGLRAADVGGKSDPYCTVEIPGRQSARLYTPVIPDTTEPVWNKRFELDFAKGDALRFTVFDKDPGSEKNHELLGHVTLTSWRLQHGFDGDLELIEGGKGFFPKLRLKVIVPKTSLASTDAAVFSGEAPVHTRCTTESDAALSLRHDAELQDVQKMPQCCTENAGWYLRSFEVLCDADYRLRRPAFEAAAQELFGGMPCSMLASRFFDVVSQGGEDIGLHAWVIMLDRFFGPVWERGQQRVAISFALYDVDGDGVITILDAVHLAGEVERLAGVLGHPPEGPSTPICEEMRMLYGKVADSTDLCGGQMLTLDLFFFNQLCPHPMIYAALQEGLEHIGRIRTPRASTPPPVIGLAEMAAGEWETLSGDTSFQGLKIHLDGKFECEHGRLSGMITTVSAADRKISLKRKKRDNHEYIFELDEDGLRMVGQCTKSSASWVLTKATGPSTGT